MKELHPRQKLNNDQWVMRHAYGFWHKLASNRLIRFSMKLGFPPTPKGHWLRVRTTEINNFLYNYRGGTPDEAY